jgi:hypothetical protein
VFCHGTTSRPKYTSGLKNAAVSFTSILDGETIKSEFDTVIANCYREVAKRSEDEEVNLLG